MEKEVTIRGHSEAIEKATVEFHKEVRVDEEKKEKSNLEKD